MSSLAIDLIFSKEVFIKQKDLFIAIKSKKNIDELFKKRFFCSNQDASLIYYKKSLLPEHADSLPPYSVLWGVNKKIGKAHDRNYIKRVARSILFEILKENAQKKKITFAFMPKPSFVTLSYHQKKEIFYKALKNIHAI